MKQFFSDKWVKIAIVVLILCIAGIIGAIVSLHILEKVDLPSIGEMMESSYRTTIEKKQDDGAVAKYEIHGDPFFHGYYPYSTPNSIEHLEYDTDAWKYRITYRYGQNHTFVFCFGDLWYTLNDEVYTMGHMPAITAAVGGVFDFYERSLHAMQDAWDKAEEQIQGTEDVTTSTVMQVPPYQEDWDKYLHVSEGFYVFVYNAESEYDHPGQPMDRSSMVTGCLYSFDCYAGKTCLITDQSVLTFMKTSEHIYYVLEAEPEKVYRTDHDGENKTVIYESTYGDVTFLRYYGSDSNGKLIAAEEQNRIIAYDIPTGETEVLMEAYLIGQFYFTPYSLTMDHVVEHISEEELGPTVLWEGKLHEGDPDKPDGDTYYYFVNTGEHWDVQNWTPEK